MWYYYKQSNARLDRIAKGHYLWNVIDDSNDPNGNDSVCSFDSKNSSFSTNNTTKVKNPTVVKDKYNGLSVDIKNMLRLHYGMNVVIMNCNDEILCVDEFGDIVCKTIDQLRGNDKISFKLLDLTEPTNPGPISYGMPIWLQIVNSAEESTNSLYQSSIIGSKLFGPPEMSSASLVKAEKVNKVKKDEETPVTSHMNSYSKNSSELLMNQIHPIDLESDVTQDLHKLPRHKIKTILPNSANEQKANDQAEICGGVHTFKTFNSTGHFFGDDKTQNDTDVSRFRSRQAWHLGEWTVQTAVKNKAVGKYVMSCAAIYLEQDLYCLGTSHGNTYVPWPRLVPSAQIRKNRKSTVLETKESSESNEEGNEHDGSDKLNASASTHSDDETSTSLSANKHQDESSVATGLSKFSIAVNSGHYISDDSDGVNCTAHACVRKVVKRGAPYEHRVDRRCVWRFFVSENPRDLKSLSVKDQKAQQLIRKAKEGLSKSKAYREGGHIHQGFELSGKPLTSGEKFPHTLRHIVSQNVFQLETAEMAERRKKEESLENYMKLIYEESSKIVFDDGVLFDPAVSPPGRLMASAEAKSIQSRDHKDQLAKSTNPILVFDGKVQTPSQLSKRGSLKSFAIPNSPLNAAKSRRQSRALNQIEQSETLSEIEKIPRKFCSGKEMLDLHTTFRALTNKVTGAVNSNKLLIDPILPRANSGAFNPHHDLEPSDYFESAVSSSSTNNTFNVNSNVRMTYKLSQLAQEDEMVQLALRHRESLNKKYEIKRLIESIK